MLPNILLIAKQSLVDRSKINDKRKDILLEIIKTWKKGDIIYPNAIKSKLYISFEEAYDLLDIFEEIGILEYVFQIYCHKCNKFQDRPILNGLNEFSDDIYCDEDHKLSPLEDTILLYRVKVDE